MKKVMVVAPYPKDETIGAGGTMLKHINSGDEVHWLILTKPEESRWGESEISTKFREVDNVEKQYNFNSVRRLNFKPNTLKEIPETELIDVLRGNVEIIKPNIIYIPFGVLNDDYKAAYEAVVKASKSFKIKVEKILCYEVISSFDFMNEAFQPNIFVDVSDYLDQKLEIMNLYETEVEGYPMPGSIESIRSLAKVRGASIATEYAEAFMLIREIH